MTTTDIQSLRHRIDALDRELVELLVRRYAVVKEVASLKRKTGMPVLQPKRVTEVLESRSRWAEELDLDPEQVRGVFEKLIFWACQEEDQHVRG